MAQGAKNAVAPNLLNSASSLSSEGLTALYHNQLAQRHRIKELRASTSTILTRIFHPILKNQYPTPPFEHQLDGIKYGLNHDKWLLLDEPGLGKTLQVIYLAEELKAQENIEHCLIICGINTLKQKLCK